jgi:deoxyribonuclease-4
MKKVARSSRPNQSAVTPDRSTLLLGAHVSTSGGLHMAIGRARSIECTAMQIFVKNNMQWFARPLRPEEIHAFRAHQQRAELSVVFAHANYLINLAAINPQFHANSIRALAEELTRADQLGLPFLVLHPGAHMGAGLEAGLDTVVASIDHLFRQIPRVKTRLALETTASRSGSAFASIRLTFSRRVTTSRRKPERKRCFASLPAPSVSSIWLRCT